MPCGGCAFPFRQEEDLRQSFGFLLLFFSALGVFAQESSEDRALPEAVAELESADKIEISLALAQVRLAESRLENAQLCYILTIREVQRKMQLGDEYQWDEAALEFRRANKQAK